MPFVTVACDTAAERPEQRIGSILVVDDDETVRRTVATILERAGFRVVAAEDGIEGLRLLQTLPDARLVILDLVMPRVNGWQFRKRQFEDVRLAAIPTVVLTGSVLTLADFEQLRAAEYLRKPVRLDDLLRVAARYCESRDHRAQ